MNDPLIPVDLPNLVVRTYNQVDHPAVSRLYTQGLLAGQIADNDTGADIENLQEAYFSDSANHFWVALVDNEVRGMIGVMRDEGHTAEIRRLRVEKAYQHTNIAHKLFEACLYHCRWHGYLKLVLDTRFEHSAAVSLFDKVGFQHTRTRELNGKELLEFYLDLYRQTK